MPHQRQTTKQAKAAFKARNSSRVSEAEIRQLERSLQLRRRAEIAKEKDNKKKALQNSKQGKASKPGLGHIRKPLGTQRTVDRFGHKSSQFHLGRFFGEGAVKVEVKTEVEEEDTEVERDGKTELEAGSDSDDTKLKTHEQAFTHTTSRRKPFAVPSLSDFLKVADADTDMEALFVSGTQIQRELETGDEDPDVDSDEHHEVSHVQNKPQDEIERAGMSRNAALSFTSFTSDDWFLESDDVEKLDPPLSTTSTTSMLTKLAQSDAILGSANGEDATPILQTTGKTNINVIRSEVAAAEAKARVDSFLMPPPPAKIKRTVSHGAESNNATIQRQSRPANSVGTQTSKQSFDEPTRRPLAAIATNRTAPDAVSQPSARRGAIRQDVNAPLKLKRRYDGTNGRRPVQTLRSSASAHTPSHIQADVSMADLEELAGMECLLTQAPGHG